MAPSVLDLSSVRSCRSPDLCPELKCAKGTNFGSTETELWAAALCVPWACRMRRRLSSRVTVVVDVGVSSLGSGLLEVKGA